MNITHLEKRLRTLNERSWNPLISTAAALDSRRPNMALNGSILSALCTSLLIANKHGNSKGDASKTMT